MPGSATMRQASSEAWCSRWARIRYARQFADHSRLERIDVLDASPTKPRPRWSLISAMLQSSRRIHTTA